MRKLFGSLILFAVTTLPVWAADSGVIVIYHHVATDTPPSTSISPDDFRRHLEYLRDNNFNVIPLDTMLESLQTGVEIPDKSVAITFDDGYISIYSEAFPLLRSFNFPFTLFLSTGPINQNQKNYMNWDQVREMSEAGVIIANHMVEHPYMLDRLETDTDEQWLTKLRTELLQAEKEIEQHTGQSHKYLAYPYGEFDKAIKELLAAEGFVGLAQNSGAVGWHTDFQAVPRFPLASIYADMDTARTKFETLAFNVTQLSPDTPVTALRSPAVTLQFESGNYNQSQINCFADSKAIPMRWLDRASGVVELTPDVEYQGRRWRYLCTAPVLGSPRFYWYSVQWINLSSAE